MKMNGIDTKRSSNIAAIGHDAVTNTLAVTFRNGGTYHYSDVTPEEYSQFAASPSMGKHLHSHLKGKEAKKV